VRGADGSIDLIVDEDGVATRLGQLFGSDPSALHLGGLLVVGNGLANECHQNFDDALLGEYQALPERIEPPAGGELWKENQGKDEF
jgi:hypothetical protein